MKIPKKIKVAGHYYKVIRICKYYNSKRARAKSEVEETLLHEILHVVDKNYNNNSLTEKAINRLSNGLYQVLKDNFKF